MTMTRPLLRIVPAGNAPADDLAVHDTIVMPVLAPEAEPPAVIVPAEPVPGRSLAGRAAALVLVAVTVAGFGWAAAAGYRAITDAWIAPLHLSPDSDAIGQLRLAHQHYLAELTRLDAEVARIDGELAAIELSIGKISSLRGSAQATLTWQAETNRVEAHGLAEAGALMKRQRAQLVALQVREHELVARARKDLAAGMVDRTAVDREEQAAGQLALQITELDRSIAEVRVKQQQTGVELAALRAGADAGLARGATASPGEMPEVAAGDEHDARLEVEIERLRAEARGDRALRAAAVASAAAQRNLLAELEARPMFRAMRAATDIAFVPYDQLSGVRTGAQVIDCTWGVFDCHPVGRVTEILPGEVATQDPWGTLARGQYIVLVLDDEAAIQQRVLRVR